MPLPERPHYFPVRKAHLPRELSFRLLSTASSAKNTKVVEIGVFPSVGWLADREERQSRDVAQICSRAAALAKLELSSRPIKALVIVFKHKWDTLEADTNRCLKEMARISAESQSPLTPAVVDNIIKGHYLFQAALMEVLLEEFQLFVDELKQDSNPPSPAHKGGKPNRKVMEQWWTDNEDRPYPSQDDKEALAKRSGLSLKQVDYWFWNKRKREKRKKAKKAKTVPAGEEDSE